MKDEGVHRHIDDKGEEELELLSTPVLHTGKIQPPAPQNPQRTDWKK